LKQFNLGNCGKLVLKDNVLAFLSEVELKTVSSAIYNGGFKKVKAILNIQTTEDYSDRQLHRNPQRLVIESAKKIGISENFVGMITAAAVDKFALVTEKDGNLSVSVTATAVDPQGATCSHSESAGEIMKVEEITGTINIMVIIDGNPTESCLVSTVLTSTEAKAAALSELDIRSRYSGDLATGTITDAIIVAKTNRGIPIVYGGPASKLGQLVGYCTKKAVKEAILKAKECLPSRSIIQRLQERHLSIEKLAYELKKIDGLKMDQQELAKTLRNEPLFASLLMAAVKIDEDIKKELIPFEFKDVNKLSENFGDLLSVKGHKNTNPPSKKSSNEEYSAVNLPPFLKQILIKMVKTRFLNRKTCCVE
jgi:adenosylcobinamide hydrolase